MKEWVHFIKLNENAKEPTKGSEYAAGYDLYAANTVDIVPGTMEFVETGLAMEIPYGHFGGIFPRSGIATKQGLRLRNSVGELS